MLADDLYLDTETVVSQTPRVSPAQSQLVWLSDQELPFQVVPVVVGVW